MTSTFESKTASLPVSDFPFLDRLNERQRAAVLTPADSALQVLAGAGTGKTELISRRFIKLVRDFQVSGLPRPQSRILVVTFTSDAAASMRQRIDDRLISNGEEGLDSDAWISTFHQFCMRLLRTHPTEAGLPPDFVIFNPMQQQVIFSRIVQEVLSGKRRDVSATLNRYRLTGKLNANCLQTERLLAKGIDNLENLLETTRLFSIISRIKGTGLSPAEFQTIAAKQSIALTEQLKALPVPHDPEASKVENIQSKMLSWQAALSAWAASEWDPLGEIERKVEQKIPGKTPTPGNYKDQVEALAAFLLVPKTFEPASPDLAPLDQALAQELAVIDLVTVVYALYQEALLIQGACDFDDLINHSIRILETHPLIQERYQRTFEAVIVDEFQDSNGSQLRLLQLIVRPQASNLTVVGDEKQSIYAFRFAQPENLSLIFRQGSHTQVSLQTNYRSDAPILEVANHHTDAMGSGKHQRLFQPEKAASEITSQPSDTTPTVPVNWILWDAIDETKDKPFPMDVQRDKEARFIALEIARLVQTGKYRFSDMAVLVKSHGKADQIQRYLTDLSIPSVQKKNQGFFQEAVIKDAMAMLRLMRHLHDDSALIRLLQKKLNHRQLRALMQWKKSRAIKSSLFDACRSLSETPPSLLGFSEALTIGLTGLINTLWVARRQKMRLNAASLWMLLAREIGLIDPDTPAWQQTKDRISLRTFHKLLQQFSQGRPLRPTLEEVLDTLDRYAKDKHLELPVSNEVDAENAVRIMTVFAAKGLEFPVVFAAYTEDVSRGTPNGDSTIQFDPQFGDKAGFGLMLGKVKAQKTLKSELYRKIWVVPREAKEAMRVFYVALTRAERLLYVLVGPKSHEWAQAADYPAHAHAVLSESSHSEILETEYWAKDPAVLREMMKTLQESP